jgi:tetratricopeptide (TPR) repeat protein
MPHTPFTALTTFTPLGANSRFKLPMLTLTLVWVFLYGLGSADTAIAQTQTQTQTQVQSASAAKISPSAATMWDEKTLNAYITAEFLAMDQQYGLAATTWLPYALRLRTAAVLELTAQWAMQGKRPDLAFAALRQWEQLEPANTKIRLTSDNILLLSQQYAALSKRLSERYASNADKQGPNDSDLLSLQQLGGQAGLGEEPLKTLYQLSKELLKPYETQGRVQYTLAGLAARAGQKAASNAHLRAGATASPPHVASLGAMAVLEPAAAVSSGLAWTQREPNNVDAWRTLGLIYAKVNQAPQAAQAFAQAITLAPKDISLYLDRKGQLKIAKQYEAARASLLAAYAQRSHLTQAQVAYTLAEHLEDDYHFDKAQELFSRAESLSSLLDFKQLAQAKQLVIRSKKLDNSDPALTAVFDELLALQYKASEAAKPSLTHIAMSALREQSRFEPALALLVQLPEDEQPYEKILIFEAMGKHAESEALLRQALENNPESATLLNVLGYGLIDRHQSTRDLIEGTGLLEKAISIYPDNYAILDSLGWAYFRAKNYSKALTLLQQAYELKRDPEVAAHLGEVLYTTGNRSQAKAIWEQAFGLDPKHKILNQTILRFK